ncbi:MAG: PAS domain S-box protein [Syntrophorhabdales bacterium]
MDAEPHRLDQLLQRTKDRYRLLAENVSDVIFTLDLNLHYTYCSPSVERLRGYTVEEVMSQNLEQVLTPASYQVASKVLEEGLAGQRANPGTSFEPQTLELELTRKGGGTVWTEVKVSFLRDQGGTVVGILGVSRDITEHRKAEDALRESEERLRAIFDGSRDAIAVTKGWIRVFVNPAYVSLFGYGSADEPLGKPIFDDIAPESRDFVMQLAKKRGRGEPVPPLYEETALKKDGTRFFAEVAVSSYVLKGEEYSCVILRDITDRKQAEDEARLLKHSIDVHYDGAYWIDSNARLVYVNDAACKSLGYERGELIGKPLLDVNLAATPEAMQKVWEQIQKGGYFLGESVHRRKDGSEFPVEIITTYVQFDGREFACGFARDVTEKKKLEGQLRQAQKMETIGTLSAGIAHDFKNILTAIEGFANLGIKYVQDESKAKRHLDRIRRAVERGKDLVGQILTYSHKSEDEPKPTELIPVIKESIRMLRASLRPTVEIRENLTTESALVLADPTQAQQIIINLATNAAYAMGQRGGTLTIELSDFSLISQNAPAPGMSEGPYLKLSISDTGTGMDRQTMERVFDPFFTTKKRTEGTGLGLWVVHSIVKKQRGAITVRSAPGEGSTFEVFLPRLIG